MQEDGLNHEGRATWRVMGIVSEVDVHPSLGLMFTSALLPQADKRGNSAEASGALAVFSQRHNCPYSQRSHVFLGDMRLIHASSLKLEEFFDDSIPPYAILSHRWGKEEVSLQEWMSADRGAIEAKEGYNKIVRACQLALSQGYEYVWADTNCIDKTSSAELSEAINSMFHWYRASHVCYAYLGDVDKRSATETIHLIKQSCWFTRGWTLQELVAPVRIEFYSRDWQCLGTKDSLVGILSDITGIQPEYLSHKHRGKWYVTGDWREYMAQELFHAVPLQQASIATRLSWLARRTTTRIEDMAYCMLGILDINMPLLYGEGRRAFKRLQEEVIKCSTDHSLFC